MRTITLQLPAYKTCWLTLALLIVCLSMLSHPYCGIIHDARLYTVEALHNLNSQAYAKDFYFLNTYQSKFSIATFIYAKLIAAFGLPAAYLLLLIAGQALWLAGAYLVTGVFFRGFSQFAALAVIVVFPSHYGGLGIFSYFESFYTPRILSEAFVLFALFFWAKRNWLACLPCIAVAFALHPLMAIPGVVALTLLMLREHKKFFWALVPAALCVFVVAAMGLEPFSNLFHVMDGNWLKAVQDRSKHLFITKWSTTDLVLTMAMFALASMAFTRSKGKPKELIWAIILTAFLLNALSLVFADELHDVLVLQLQLWRASWLLFFIVAVSFYDMASSYSKQNPFGLAATTLVCFLFFGIIPSHYFSTTLFIGIALFALLCWTSLSKLRWDNRNTRNRIIVYIFALAIILLFFKIYDYNYMPQSTQLERIYVVLSIIVPAATAIVLFIGHNILKRQASCNAYLAITIIMTLICMTISDRQKNVQRLFFANDAAVRKVQHIIPTTSLVFWPGACDLAWLYVQRANFISILQAAGVTFSKQQAEEYIKKEWLASLDSAAVLKNGLANISLGTGEKLFSSTKVDYICKQYPQLDFIIIPDNFPNLKPVASVSFNFIYTDYLRYFPSEQPIIDPRISIYSCNVIRNMTSSAQSVDRD